MLRSHRFLVSLVLGGLALAGAAPALAVQAGITLDVHQDIFDQALWPNDFHIEGLICSNDGTWPVLIDHIDGPFTLFSHSIYKLPGDDCWYWFEATWATPPGLYIPYCTVIHLGLLFDVDAANVIIDLVGWWTRDGMPVGGIIGNLNNTGYVPLVGFNVQDTASPQKITIGNGDIPITPPLPMPPMPTPPWPPAPIEYQVLRMDVVPFPPGEPPDFRELYENGQQQFFPWVPIVYADGTPINRGRPLYVGPDSFFDVFLELSVGTGLRSQTPAPTTPGGFLVARQLVRFLNNYGEPEERWFWEIHGAQQTEACCFADGHCEDLLPFTCTQRGGQPMGLNTFCATTTCPMLGACCYGQVAILCVVTDQLTCQQQYLGQWMGPGTDCADLNGNLIADICEPQEVGACCFGEVAIQCIITDQATCLQLVNGVWKGVGTNCDDLNGNQIADICEEPVKPEACCLPDGTCLMLLPADCLNSGGVPKGPGSRCLGDRNGNGVDDICETKWLQLPDLETTGIDVDATMPLILADDFLCNERGAITDITVWGSWYHDLLPGDPLNVQFTLSIHEDIPAGPGGYSQPGPPVWMRVFPPGSFQVIPYQTGIQEGWWNPAEPQSYEFPGDTVCWQYYFRIPPEQAFCQKGTPQQPKVYWLDVQAQPLGGPVLAQFGWKTSTQHWNDDAVWGMGQEPYPGPWQELRYPPPHPLHGQSIDLAFALATDSLCYCRGDMNCDGKINFADINPFVLALSNPAAWKAAYPGCPVLNGDINGDGVVNFGDINPFVALLSASPPPTCP
jgi:hypothetical protein